MVLIRLVVREIKSSIQLQLVFGRIQVQVIQKISGKFLRQILPCGHIDKSGVQHGVFMSNAAVEHIAGGIQYDTEDCQRQFIVIPDILYFLPAVQRPQVFVPEKCRRIK